MFGQYLQFFASMDVPCKRKAYYVIQVSFNTIKSVITYHTQEWNEDQRYFGHYPGHFELALGSLSNSPGTTCTCTELSSLFIIDALKMNDIKHLSVVYSSNN